MRQGVGSRLTGSGEVRETRDRSRRAARARKRRAKSNNTEARALFARSSRRRLENDARRSVRNARATRRAIGVGTHLHGGGNSGELIVHLGGADHESGSASLRSGGERERDISAFSSYAPTLRERPMFYPERVHPALGNARGRRARASDFADRSRARSVTIQRSCRCARVP